MAKFAPVAPLAVAKVLKEEGSLGNYHLLLAHDVVEHPAEYREVYEEYCNPFGLGTVILDNSLIELGKSFSFDGVIEAAEIIEPHFVVLPDTLGDMRATVEASREFHSYLQEKDKLQHMSFMGVIQGQNMSECMQCAFELEPIVHGFCVPRVLTQLLGSRTEITQWLISRFRNKSYHLLGFSDDILDDICTARLYGVGGIDSAAPIRLGMQGFAICISDMVMQLAGPRGDFWETPESSARRWADVVNDNLTILRQWIAPRVVE